MSAPTSHCDPKTKIVAYAICAELYARGTGCICRRNGKPPCDHMVLAACAAEKIIVEREGAR